MSNYPDNFTRLPNEGLSKSEEYAAERGEELMEWARQVKLAVVRAYESAISAEVSLTDSRRNEDFLYLCQCVDEIIAREMEDAPEWSAKIKDGDWSEATAEKRLDDALRSKTSGKIL